MNNLPLNIRLDALLHKGGVMFFTIEREEYVYSGMVLLTPVEDGFRRRAVYMKECRVQDHSIQEVNK